MEPPRRCVQVDVDAAHVDVASGAAWAAGVDAVHELDLGDRRVRLVAGGEATAVEDAAAALSAWGAPEVFDAEHDGWLDAWRPFARPVETAAIVVHPAWEPAPPSGGRPVLSIDPGRSFGQGGHATTRTLLDELAGAVAPGARVLDVGCGSGVLGLAAVALGAGSLRSVDVDPEAVAATMRNAEANGLVGRVEVDDAPVGSLEESFDLVLVNIVLPMLVDLADGVLARVASGGRLLVGGWRSEQRQRVAAAYAALSIVGERSVDGWGVLTLEDARPVS